MYITLRISMRSDVICFSGPGYALPSDYAKSKLNLNQIESVLKKEVENYDEIKSSDKSAAKTLLRQILNQKKVKTNLEYEFLINASDYNLYKMLKSNSLVSMKTFQKIHKINSGIWNLGSSDTTKLIRKLVEKEKELYG